MSEELEEAAESIDASVFSGDLLHNASKRAKFKEYVERWHRAIEEAEKKMTTMIRKFC